MDFLIFLIDTAKSKKNKKKTKKKQTNKKESYDPKQESKYVSRECFVWLWLPTIGLK